MWPLWIFLRTYAPYVTFPVALVIGFVGYNVEKRIREDRDRQLTYLHKSVPEERNERILEQYKQYNSSKDVEYESLKTKKFKIPPTKFDRKPTDEPAKDEGLL